MQLHPGFRFFFAVVALCDLALSVGTAQSPQPSTPIVIGGTRGIDGRDCDTTKANFDLIAHTAGEQATIIVIGRLGRAESSRKLVRRRLRNLQEFIYFTRGISKERIITAEGERVPGLGQVDVYIGGKLFMKFHMSRNRDFLTKCQP